MIVRKTWIERATAHQTKLDKLKEGMHKKIQSLTLKHP